jgi:hypothetical protein
MLIGMDISTYNRMAEQDYADLDYDGGGDGCYLSETTKRLWSKIVDTAQTCISLQFKDRMEIPDALWNTYCDFYEGSRGSHTTNPIFEMKHANLCDSYAHYSAMTPECRQGLLAAIAEKQHPNHKARTEFEYDMIDYHLFVAYTDYSNPVTNDYFSGSNPRLKLSGIAHRVMKVMASDSAIFDPEFKTKVFETLKAEKVVFQRVTSGYIRIIEVRYADSELLVDLLKSMRTIDLEIDSDNLDCYYPPGYYSCSRDTAQMINTRIVPACKYLEAAFTEYTKNPITADISGHILSLYNALEEYYDAFRPYTNLPDCKSLIAVRQTIKEQAEAAETESSLSDEEIDEALYALEAAADI